MPGLAPGIHTAPLAPVDLNLDPRSNLKIETALSDQLAMQADRRML